MAWLLDKLPAHTRARVATCLPDYWLQVATRLASEVVPDLCERLALTAFARAAIFVGAPSSRHQGVRGAKEARWVTAALRPRRFFSYPRLLRHA